MSRFSLTLHVFLLPALLVICGPIISWTILVFLTIGSDFSAMVSWFLDNHLPYSLSVLAWLWSSKFVEGEFGVIIKVGEAMKGGCWCAVFFWYLAVNIFRFPPSYHYGFVMLFFFFLSFCAHYLFIHFLLSLLESGGLEEALMSS